MADPDLPDGYPVEWEADVVLRDGSVAHIRPIRPDDAAGLRRFHNAQSPESTYLRFFAPMTYLSDRDVHRFTHVDYRARVALVVTHRGEIIGVGRFDRIDERDAEVAFNISDDHQGKGIGSVLLEHLADIARDLGLTAFEAEVLPQNNKMLSVFADAGYQVSRRVSDGIVQVHFDIEPTESSESVRLSREHRAESVSIAGLLAPANIAVVGAGRADGSAGRALLRHLADGGFTGGLYPVNRTATAIDGFTAYERVSDIPVQVDLAVIATPASQVLDVVEDCAQAGVHGLVVVSAGFAETGVEGARLERRLLRRARDAGMRVVGPTSFGVINTAADVRMNASLAPALVPGGHFGLFAQSGPLGIAVLESAARRRLGISSFASAGNRLDVSGNDLMQYWMDDPRTHAVGLYLESMGNPRKFSRIARRLALVKPVVVIKSGISRYGAPPGHLVRETHVPPAAFTAMLKQAGVIRVENIHQMFDVAQLLIHQPEPRGRRVAIVGNSVQLAALTAETADSAGLEIVHGPTSVLPDAPLDEFRVVLRAAFLDRRVDAVLICFTPPLARPEQEAIDVIRSVAAEVDKTCVATMLGTRGIAARDTPRPTSVTVADHVEPDEPDRELAIYDMPEAAVAALAATVRYAEWRRKDKGLPFPRIGMDRRAAEALVGDVLAEDPSGRYLVADECERLLAAYGVPLWPRREAYSPDEAVAAAEELGYPVVVKTLSPLVRGQSVIDGIRVDLKDAAAVRAAFDSLDERLAPLDANHFAVQRMAGSGISCIVGCSEDPLFGPVVRFSVAGPPTTMLDDIGYRIPPLTDIDVSELISSIKAAPLLHGYRGAPPVHRGALGDIIGRVSMLADDLPEISSLELNPVVAHPGGVDVLGAEILISPPAKRADSGRRALT